MLSSATCPCWTYELLRKPTSQHPHEQGPKSILEPGCHLTSTEVPACPQGGTSNNQFGGSSLLPLLYSFAHSVFGKPRTTQILPSQPCDLRSPLPWETCLPQALALSLTGSWPPPYRLQPAQPGQGVAEPPSFYRDTPGRERACKSHSQGREHLWLPSVLRPIRGAGIVVEGGTTLQNQRC